MTSRRTFLKQSALMAGASMWPNIILNKPKRQLGVALVGLGYYSTDLLAPALQLTRHCKLTGIVTGTPSKIPVWQEKYGIKDENVFNYDNMYLIANNEDIDVIYIVLPTGLHSKYAIIAADTGKHVWCEKPMARNVLECENVIYACKQNGVKLSIGYRMQHEPNTQTIVSYASDKPYGNIKMVNAEAGYYDSRSDHWKQQKELGGGALYDMGVYPINAARYVTGENPVAVLDAWHDTNRPDVYHEVDETTGFTLEFASGARARCKTSFGESMNRLWVECDNGWYSLSPFQSYNGVKGITSDGIKLNKPVANQQAKQMDDDALSIINDKDVLVPGEDGLEDIRVVEAVYESARKGGQRIAL